MAGKPNNKYSPEFMNSGEYLLFGFPAILKPSCTFIVQEGIPFLFTVHFQWGSSRMKTF